MSTCPLLKKKYTKFGRLTCHGKGICVGVNCPPHTRQGQVGYYNMPYCVHVYCFYMHVQIRHAKPTISVEVLHCF